jgi:drug/metabolite transporter (DMT)-like permease
VNTRRSGALAIAVLSAVCFGGSGTFAEPLIGSSLGSLHTVWLRVTGAALVLLPVVVRRHAQARGHLRMLLGYGLFPVAGAQTCYFVAITRLPVGVALLVEYLGPVFVLLWTRFVVRRPVTRTAAAGAVLAVCGMACVVEIWSVGTGGGLDPIGLAFALGAALCQASYFLLSAHAGDAVDPMLVISVGLVAAAVALGLISRAWSTPWSDLAHRLPLGDHGAVPGWVLLAYVSVVTTAIAYVTGVIAVRRLSPPVASVVGTIEAVVATVLAWVVLGQHLGPAQLVGGALVLVGALVAQSAAAEPVPATPESVPVGPG